jgi:organic hydroperoxide reductase OsmC/OhrA
VAISSQRLRPKALSFLAGGPGHEGNDAQQLFGTGYAACLLGAMNLSPSKATRMFLEKR